MGLVLSLALAGCTEKEEENTNGNVVPDTTNKDEIVVITMTDCPECREGLKPYLDKAKNELGVNIKEYQVSSPFDPEIDQILSENGLKRTRGGMPIVFINGNCFTIMSSVEAALNEFLENK